MDEWEDLALNNRRLPHGRVGKRGKGAAEFNPKTVIGTYTFSLSAKGKGRSAQDDDDDNDLGDGLFEVHALDETEEGFDCSFRLGGKVEGMMLLAGSRKTLEKVVNAAEGVETTTSQYEDGDEDDGASGSDSEGSVSTSKSALEKADDRINDRIATFEKNSFRTPKFWACWKAKVQKGSGKASVEKDSAYFVFSKNNCRSFTGTISSPSLGWNNVPIMGRKVKNKVAASNMSWSDL